MKLDLTSIEGYKDDLTAEEKLKLLLDADITVPNTVSKETFDKTASDLAKYKKQAMDAMSEAEKKQAQRDEEFNTLKAERDELVKSSAISKNKAQYLALGYDDESADKAAQALYSGDTDVLFNLHKTMTEKAKETAIADKVKSMTQPTGGDPNTKSFTKEQIATMTPDEINKNWDAVSEAMKN